MLLFVQKKYGPGWMGGWMDGRAGLRIAYSNKKFGGPLKAETNSTP